MPSPIGHALAGVAVAWTAGDGQPTQDRRLAWLCAALGASADLDLLLPYTHRVYTHSIGAVILITIVSAVVTGWVTRPRALRLALVCGAAYATHLLLDWMAVDTHPPYGIRALWPFDSGWYISGWNVFNETARRHLLSRITLLQNARAIVREIAILGPVVVAIGVARFFVRRASTETPA